LVQAAKEYSYETEAGNANEGWNFRGGLQWPDCVWRGVFAVAGYREESFIEQQSSRAQSGEVNYIDSGGLGTLVALRTSAQNAGGTIKLTSLTKHVSDLLQITKLLTVFDVYNSEAEAVESFRKAA